MSTGLLQVNNGDENATVNMNKSGKPKPLQASTNIIHTKTPRRIDNLIYDKSRQLPGKRPVDLVKRKQASASKKNPDLKSSQTSKASENDVQPIPKSTGKKATSSATPSKKVDENDVGAMIKNAYDPLNDFYPLDEELFQKVKKLEYADDGIPAFDYSEPFDF